MNITQDGISITNRFFQAIDILKIEKRMRGLQTFTRNHNLNRWNMVTLRDNPSSRYLQAEWIAWLCSDYNISPDWILFGVGQFYRDGIPPKTNTKNRPRKQTEDL
ncbi:MAG: hypothetical protein NC229_08680 [Bacteroides sp.]|nr:hypothetical protein [Bacteroides sp.]MCM1403801.1 hypothetical protein [Bacteroides sp.]MCM1443547.1 hypothetical protein [Muribaculum sp.]MCM1577118.1 hypothetical protein [Bacteroides sp.]